MEIKTAVQGILILFLGLITPAVLYAAEMTITADFTPSIANPTNNQFTNTTPLSGYCHTWPHYCSDTKSFSIDLPLTAVRSRPLTPSNPPRDGLYIQLPGAAHSVILTNTVNNTTTSLQFRINSFSARLSEAKNSYAWSEGHLGYSPSPCVQGATPVGSAGWTAFLWQWPESNAACYKTSTIDRSGADYEKDSLTLYDMGIGYILTTPNPLALGSGTYIGSLTLTVGPGGDIDFGDNYQPNDNIVNLNFWLSVNHELSVTPRPDATAVTLQPCAPGKICSEAEGLANWERWMVTNITPQALTGRSSFDISSSGAFTVFLNCQYQAGEHCGIKSDNTNSVVPVQSLLTLPTHIYNTSGNAVTRRRLYTSKNTSRNLFFSRAFSTGSPGYIDFEVARKDIDAMLVNRPDNYSGVVTVIFDPDVF